MVYLIGLTLEGVIQYLQKLLLTQTYGISSIYQLKASEKGSGGLDWGPNWFVYISIIYVT